MNELMMRFNGTSYEYKFNFKETASGVYKKLNKKAASFYKTYEFPIDVLITLLIWLLCYIACPIITTIWFCIWLLLMANIIIFK